MRETRGGVESPKRMRSHHAIAARSADLIPLRKQRFHSSVSLMKQDIM